jgi:multidrug efflux pump subunit AcrB
VSTTITTFGGFLPLILEGGRFWPPFAVAIAGGVLLSTVISFFLVPPLFYLTVRRYDVPEALNVTEGAPG